MNPIALLLLIGCAAALLMLPREWVMLPLLVGACYMTAGQQIQVGPFHFTFLRLLLLVGAIRIVVHGERLQGGINFLDVLIFLWGAWLLFSAPFHRPIAEALVFRLGATYNVLGFYFLVRFFCHDAADFDQLIKSTAILLVPVALEMVYERMYGRDLFGYLGGVPETPLLRDGVYRAQGPFAHSILAGTVGAMCMPLMIGIWARYRTRAVVGLFACITIVVMSKSTGPLMSIAFGGFALLMWRWRHLTRRLWLAALLVYVVLDIIAPRPAYYAILNRIDLTGSSTGWHRAELIKQAVDHLSEWWFVGTDYTRHWMPYGVSASPDHSDITNQYIFYGTWAGLPLVLLFVTILWTGGRYVGDVIRRNPEPTPFSQFTLWSLGAAVFSWAVTGICAAFFDQSIMFLYMTLAAISSMRAASLAAVSEVTTAVDSVENDRSDEPSTQGSSAMESERLA